MRRKVVQQGPATLMISLPSKWTKKYGIKKGDEIDLEEKNSNLIIEMQKKQPEISRKIIDISGLNSSLIWRTLIAAYINGFEEIEIRFDNPKIFYSGRRKEELRGTYLSVHSILEEIAGNLIGFEILDQTKNKCIFRELTRSKEHEFDVAFKRMFFLIKENISELIKYIENKDKATFTTIYLREQTLNRFAHLCLRLLTVDRKTGFPQYHTITLLEDFGDQLFKIAQLVRKIGKSSIVEPIKIVREIFDSTYEFYFKTKKTTEHFSQIIDFRLYTVKNEKKYEPFQGFFDYAIEIFKSIVSNKIQENLMNSKT